ncbi:MAG: type 4a pilus biogenesis protein PilO [Cellvibrionaceae bacterium]
MALNDVVEKLNNLDVNDLSELDWNAVGTWHIGIRSFLWGAVFILVLALAFFFHIKELNQTLDKITREEETLKTDFAKMARDAANLEKYRLQMVEMEEQFGALLRQLPTDTEVPGLLEDIDERGEKSGLTISAIDLQSEVAREYYIELPIEVHVTGGYHDFGSFVSGVAGMPRIVTLHDYTIKLKDDGFLDMTIQAKTYRYKDQEG